MEQDASALSRDYAHRFTDSRYFHFLGYSHNERELTPRLTDNTLRAAIIIPEHFEQDLLAGRPAQVQTLIVKEWLQLARDLVLPCFLAYAFTVDVYLAGSVVSLQLNRAAFAVHDSDHSFA